MPVEVKITPVAAAVWPDAFEIGVGVNVQLPAGADGARWARALSVVLDSRTPGGLGEALAARVRTAIASALDTVNGGAGDEPENLPPPPPGIFPPPGKLQ